MLTTLNGAIETAFRSKISKAITLVKWISIESVEKCRRIINKLLKNMSKQLEQAVPLLSDDLQDREKQIQAVKYENVEFQWKMRAKDQQINIFQNTINQLRQRYVNHARDPDKDNLIIIVKKSKTPAVNKPHDLLYYVSRIQWHKRQVKLIWLIWHFTDYEVIAQLENSKTTSMHSTHLNRKLI